MLLGILLITSTVLVYKLVDWLYHMPLLKDLNNKYILITGSDTGFGLLLARRLDTMGCHVIASCLTEDGVARIKCELSSRSSSFIMDVVDSQSVSNGVVEVERYLPRGKGLWAVVNNAGIGDSVGTVELFSKQDYQRAIDVNLLGTIDVATKFLPLIKRECGRVVNMASVLGRFTFAEVAPYCVSKYGVESFSDSLRRTMRYWGVKVSMVEPGFYRTPLNDYERIVKVFRKVYSNAPPEAKIAYGKRYAEAYEKRLERMTSGACKRVDDVVDAYTHALLACHPRSRYLVGNDAKFIFTNLQLLPEYIGDRLFSWLNSDILPDNQ